MMVRAPVPLHRAWREVGAHAQKRGLHQTPRQHVGAQLHSDGEGRSAVYSRPGLGAGVSSQDRPRQL